MRRRPRGPVGGLALVVSTCACAPAAAFDPVSLPDAPLELRLDAAPLRLVLTNLLDDVGAGLALELEREVVLDGRYAGTLHGLLERLESEHALEFREDRDAGRSVVTVLDASAVPTPDEPSAPNRAPSPRTDALARVAGEGRAAEAPRAVEDIPGFETF